MIKITIKHRNNIDIKIKLETHFSSFFHLLVESISMIAFEAIFL